MLTDDNTAPTIGAPTEQLPACVRSMQCYCAGHANGLDASAPCDTAEPLSARLTWGSWPIPYAAPVAWGARAIYRLDSRGGRTVAVVDLLHDRQGLVARDFDITSKDRAAIALFREFTKWIDKVAMPALRKECAKRYITPDSNVTIEIERDGYKLVAGPRGSYGYLYIRAWKVA